ncbi:MAG: hypothetical protein ACI9LU_001015 [Polaribacter sp.]|jgi:hypothetical protein
MEARVSADYLSGLSFLRADRLQYVVWVGHLLDVFLID